MTLVFPVFQIVESHGGNQLYKEILQMGDCMYKGLHMAESSGHRLYIRYVIFSH